MSGLQLFCLLLFTIHLCDGDLIEISDQKVFKKFLRTHVNVLVFFQETSRSGRDWLPALSEAAQEMEGKASVVQIDCSAAKKLCKYLKAKPTPITLKHFRVGKFHKDYDRLKTAKSIARFLEDPTSDVPWDEDASASSVAHVDSAKSLVRLLTREPKPILIMFYAPWCGYCKQMKPQFAAAAQDLKTEAVLAGMDVDKPELMAVRQQFNISGFPTLYYIHGGKVLFKYGGENTKAAIVQWMRNPQPPKEPETEKQWADEEGAQDIHFLTSDSFAPFLQQNPSVLVMFYAPWCGHCKAMKPAFGEVATKLKAAGLPGVLAAVDATKESSLAEKFKVQGFPTVKYFKDGEFAFDFNQRSGDKLLEFMKDPKEPPPPPPPEPQWSEQPSDVHHLTTENFNDFLRKKKHVLTMFYAPWCGHCKKAKPEFTRAAEVLKENRKAAFAAVDCTVHSEICNAEGVSGYPTFHHYVFGKKDPKGYGLGREEEDFVAFMSDPAHPKTVGQVKNWKAVPGFESVTFLDKENFQQTLASHEALFVKFYAPWCGHCKAMKPAFVQLAQLVKERKLPVAVGAVDATADEDLAQKFGVSGYPTLLHLTSDGKAEKYRGSRSAEDMLSYIEGKLSTAETQNPIEQEKKAREEEEEQKRIKEEEEEKRKIMETERKAEEERQRKDEEEKLKKEEMERLKREEEMRRKEEEEKQKKKEEERKRKKEQEERKRKEEEERKRKKEEERKRKEEEERKRKKEEEERKRKKEEEEMKRKKEEEERKRKKEEEERKRKKEEEERKRKKEEEERKRKREEEERKRKKEEEERKRKKKEEERRRKKEEEERKRKKEVEERRRKKEEEERKRKKEEEERKRKKEEEEQRKRKKEEEEQRKRKKEEEQRKRKKEEEQRKRKKEEEERKRKKEEEARKRREEKKKKEEEERKREEEERRKKEEEERIRKEEAKKRMKKEEEARRREEEEERKRKKEEERIRIEEEEKRTNEKTRPEQDRAKQQDSNVMEKDETDTDTDRDEL